MPLLPLLFSSSPKSTETSDKANPTSYYGRPILKKAHWHWHIWFYFWIGGIAAGASVIAALAQIFGDKNRHQPIVRAGRYISLVGMLISPVLLILDLKRPERFLHMLRIIKLRSPLNLGTYILTSTGVLSGLNAARQLVKDELIPAQSLPGKAILATSGNFTGALQGMGGLALGSYTGVLLSATATPLWSEGALVIAPLFLSSAFSSGAASITLACTLAGVNKADLHSLDQIERLAIVSEVAFILYGMAKLKPELRLFITSGKYRPFFLAFLFQAILIPLLSIFFQPKSAKLDKVVVITKALMILSGSFWLRYSIVEAGKASIEIKN